MHGTLIEAWASTKSCRPRDETNDHGPPKGGHNPKVDFRGEKRRNAMHDSTNDPEAKLYRNGPGMLARLCFMGYAWIENRSGLLVEACPTQAGGDAGRIPALAIIEPRAERMRAGTLGADRCYNAADFVNELRILNVSALVAQNTSLRSAIDGHTTRPDYKASLRALKRLEEAFGWMKRVAGIRRPMLCGMGCMGFAFTFTAAAYNLVRLPQLLAGRIE